ncbi:hypothetical protein ILUMI_09113 [Ignelater luminosus]|uniref:Serine/threonine-protein kinase RIO3 n=1 Tax=Ignelater luminosus TaxID=2038154 RepID=A0A8K0GFC9_IGNLU|nr:hypothetical protein ILUMI_09113 [Ignelater luminosus]
MSSPWAKIPVPEPLNLKDIMFEESTKENKKSLEETNSQSDIDQELLFHLETEENLSDPGTDAAIATILQQEYDEEYNETLKTTKEKQNYASMFFPQWEFPMRKSDFAEIDSDSDEEELESINLRHSDEVISKYDVKLNDGKNKLGTSLKSSSLVSSDIDDYAITDFRLSDKVCNSLKLYSKREQSKREKLHDKKEDNATAEFALDYSTRLQLHKLINKQLLERINGIISVGKEAVILHANSDPSYPDAVLPKNCAVKVYKTTLADFKQREIYIREDKRFIGRIGKQSIKKTIHLWAEKEMRNLFRLQKAGIFCPEPIALKRHVLVMSFIGEDHHPAPKLKYAAMKTEEYDLAYNQVVEAMVNLYNKARLIHCDLSEYNILWHDRQCYLIDVSQSVEPTHTDAFCFLFRDCENITKFFSHKHVPNMKTARELFTEITGFDYFDRVAMEEASNFSKSKPNVMDECDTESNNIFETEWQKIMEDQFEQQQVTTSESIEKNIIDPLNKKD